MVYQRHSTPATAARFRRA